MNQVCKRYSMNLESDFLLIFKIVGVTIIEKKETIKKEIILSTKQCIYALI
jgi:hypothetical protein